ncbi:MAG: type I 3-dehydroquinate dehydratase [Nitrospirae bacterium]|nr:type I 3-dehydroquinate dehydratase [Nitrospirota bacterium]
MSGIGIRIGSLTLGQRPAIAVPLTNVDIERLDTLHGADLIELRIDMFEGHLSQQGVMAAFTMARGRFDAPIIATCRSTDEGGVRPFTDNERLEILSLVTPLSDAVDIEINSAIAPDVIKLVKEAGKTVITSYHDFKRTPPLKELDAIIARCKEAGTHITKIAVMANSQDDVETMRRFTLNHHNDDIITISMGSIGMGSRVLFPKIGSLLTFASIKTVSALGQMSIHEVIKHLR